MRGWNRLLELLDASAPAAARRSAPSAVPPCQPGAMALTADLLLGVFGRDLAGEADDAGLRRRIADRAGGKAGPEAAQAHDRAEMLMIEPGPGSINASALRVLRNMPRRLTAISRSQSATLYSWVRGECGVDAGVVDEDVDAAVIGRDPSPQLLDGELSSATSTAPPRPGRATAWPARRSRRRRRDCLSAQITVAPNAASPSANERPSPLPAPVTTAILPSRRNRFSNMR